MTLVELVGRGFLKQSNKLSKSYLKESSPKFKSEKSDVKLTDEHFQLNDGHDDDDMIVQYNRCKLQSKLLSQKTHSNYSS